jgi:hypothetical protein
MNWLTVIRFLSDLRGDGDSSKLEGGEGHINYSLRAMAQGNVQVMKQYGHDSFFLDGHDPGGRVADRLCLDHPEAVRKVPDQVCVISGRSLQGSEAQCGTPIEEFGSELSSHTATARTGQKHLCSDP